MSLTSKLTTIAAAGAGSEPDLFVLSVRSTTNYPLFADIDVDSSGNIVTVGYVNTTEGAGGYDSLILKLDSSGSILWSTISGLTSTDTFSGVATDSSDNIYAAGYITDGVAKGYIKKVSSSGVTAWEKTISSARNCLLWDCDISTDESTLFFGGSSDQHNYGINTSADGFYWGKVNTSDGSSLVDYIEGYTYSQQCRCVSTNNNNGTVVFGGSAGYTTAATMDFFLQASQSNVGSTAEVFPFGGQNGAYVADVAHGPNNKTWAIVSGNRSWYFDMTNTTVNDDRINNTTDGRGYGVVTDSLGNVYFLSYRTTSGSRHTYINKFDDSFNLLWSRKLRGVTTSHRVIPSKIAISNDDQYLYVCGTEDASLNGGFSGFIFKFPTDGSLTDTYGNFVYEDVFQNIGATGRTNRTNVSTRVSAPLSLGTPSLTTNTFTPSSTSLEEG